MTSRLTKRKAVIRYFDSRFYPTFGNNWDDDLLRQTLMEVIDERRVVLDLGAGRGILKQLDFRNRADRVWGADLDPAIASNPFLDGGLLADAGVLPLTSGSIDVVIANNLLEHLTEPEKVFAEVARVLRPGGIFVIKTPNRRHYVTLLSRITPHALHGVLVGMRGRSAEDVYPTVYRANVPEDVRRFSAAAGLTVRSMSLVEGRPEYCRIVWPLYAVGILYERLVNRFAWLARFRVIMIASFERPYQSTT